MKNPLLVLVGSNVGVAVGAVVVGILARIHDVGQPSTGPASGIIQRKM